VICISILHPRVPDAASLLNSMGDNNFKQHALKLIRKTRSWNGLNMSSVMQPQISPRKGVASTHYMTQGKRINKKPGLQCFQNM
jgi:hypothetical protein